MNILKFYARTLTVLILIVLAFSNCGKKGLNLLIFHTDQQSQWTIGAYGLDHLRGSLTTPNLDKFASQGIRFTNFFTNSAVCSPSRALMMTGCYATKNGVFNNNQVMNHIPTLGSLLSKAGYHTAYMGKWHLSGTAKPGWAPDSYGWADNRFMFNRGHYKKIVDSLPDQPQEFPYRVIGDEESYTSDWLTNKAIAFIQDHNKKKFGLMLSYPDPHQPWEVREPFNAMYAPSEFQVPDSYFQRNNPLTAWHENMLRSHKKLSQSRLKQIKATYAGSVHLLDFQFGRIVDLLKELGLYEQTLVIYTSDHGEYMGEHGLLYKNQFFETAYRLPLLMHVPQYETSMVINSITSMVDFLPGVLSLLDVDLPDDLDGRDFSLTLSPGNDWSNEAHVHHSQHQGAGVFTQDYYLILHQSGAHILFNRITDPGELYNLYQDPAFATIRDSLTHKVLQHHQYYQTPEWTWLNTQFPSID